MVIPIVEAFEIKQVFEFSQLLSGYITCVVFYCGINRFRLVGLVELFRVLLGSTVYGWFG